MQQFVSVMVIAALTFGVCYLFDKGFTRLFRNKEQHKSGKAVRPSRRFAAFGAILVMLGFAALFVGLDGQKAMLFGGPVVVLIGLGLVIYYMTFGVFYDDEGFVLTTFGRKSTAYRFADIREQRLYVIQGGSTVIELHLTDGRSVGLQSTMDGTFPFLDHAFSAWCRQTGRDPEDCDFHDPARHMWFPGVEEA